MATSQISNPETTLPDAKQFEYQKRKERLISSGVVTPFRPHRNAIVYGYTRVSTEKQVLQGCSLEDQEGQIRKYCDEKGLPEPIIISDPACSGRNVENRPNFLRMMTLVRDGDIIIASSISRLARNTRTFLNFLESLREKRIKLVVLKEYVDLNYNEKGELAPYSAMAITMMASFAQMEAEMTKTRTKSAMEHLKKTGNLRTKPKFGWEWKVDEEGKKTLIEVEEEQKVIDFVAAAIIADPSITVAEILRRFNGALANGEILYGDRREVKYYTIHRIVVNNNLRGNGSKSAKPVVVEVEQ